MKFLRNVLMIFAVLQLVSNAQAFFAGPYYGGYGPYYGGWGYGGWGYPSRDAAIAGTVVGGATNLIGTALTADAINKSQPGYWEYKAEREQRRAQEAQDRREARGQYYRNN